MNRLTTLFTIVLAGLAAASCQLVDIKEETRPEVSLTMNAGVEQTKTFIQDLTVLWGENESVMLYYNDGVDKFAESSSFSTYDSDTKAKFAFNVSPASAESYRLGGVYPASSYSDGNVTLPAVQSPSAATYDPAAFIMVLKPETVTSFPTEYEAWFRRAAALNKITLKSVKEDISKVEISSEGKAFAGAREIDFTTGSLDTPSNASSSVTINYATPLTAGDIDVWFTSWDVEIASGETLTIKVTSTSNTTYTRTITARGEGIHFAEDRLNLLSVGFGDTAADKVTIGDFAREFVKVIDIWKQTTGTINLLKGETAKNDAYDVAGAHYLPESTTFTLGGKTYSTADMFETALRSYLLLKGKDGNNTSASGAGSFDSKTCTAATLSGTEVPATHSYKWGEAPYSETSGNGGYLQMTSAPGFVKDNFLYNYASRNVNYPVTHTSLIANIAGYNASQLSGYKGSCCPKRALLTFAYYFKYMLDNNLDSISGISSDQLFRTVLFWDDAEAGSKNGIWVWGTSMSSVSLEELASKGIGNVFVLEPGADNKFKTFAANAKNLGITVHVWIRTFNDGSNWINPVDTENQCYNQARFDAVLATAKAYMALGAKGVHFDYIRYPGTSTNKASLYSYKSGTVTGIGAITEFCRQAKQELKAIDPDVILSAAVMAEKSAWSYYGQKPSEMGQYMDVIIPMIYRYTDSGSYGASWAQDMADWFATQSEPAEMWAGTTTYTGSSSVTGMSADAIRSDCEDFVGHADGVVLFRFGLGAIPDLKTLWN